MGIFKSVFGGAANTAKYEYKTQKLKANEEKIERKEALKKQKHEEIVKRALISVDVVGSDIKRVKAFINDFTNTIAKDIEAMNSCSSNSKKGSIKKQIIQNLKYLYLSSDFFTYAIKLKKEYPFEKWEYDFITTFPKFFNGTMLLNEDDSSFLSDFKETVGLFKETFSGKGFESPYDKLLSPNKENIESLKVINLSDVIKVFEQFYNNKEEINVESADKTHSKKFCPQCGTKLETDSKFCPQCGFKL